MQSAVGSRAFVLPGLDPDEVLRGQLLTVLTALLGLLALHLLAAWAQALL
jgi:hypothetical protein